MGALDRSRFELHALSPAGPACDVLREAGARVHEAPVAAFTHIWASSYHGLRWALLGRELARLPAAHRALARVLHDVRPALVHLNDSPLVHAAWQAHRAGLPVVWHLRSALPDGGGTRSRLVRRTIRALAARAVAINEDVAASFDVDAVVVPDAVDLARFRPSPDPAGERERLGLARETPAVSFFGYLYPAKGFREFLAAAALVRARGVEAQYLVVGGGVRGREFFASPGGRLLARSGVAPDWEGEARALAAGLGIADAVRFVGYVADPAPFYRASDVVVAPSRGPELGLPAIEAAASGVPLVATGSTGGAGVVVPGETGILAARTGPEPIARAVARLLGDEAERSRLGRAARARAERLFSVPATVETMERVYVDALETQGPRLAGDGHARGRRSESR